MWSYGVKELESSGLHILNGAHSSLVTLSKMCRPDQSDVLTFYAYFLRSNFCAHPWRKHCNSYSMQYWSRDRDRNLGPSLRQIGVQRTVGELKDWTKRHLWSKIILNTGGMGGARVNPPTCKMGTFLTASNTR